MEKIRISDEAFVIKEHITHFNINVEKKNVVEIYLVSERQINVNFPDGPDAAKEFFEMLKSKFD